MKIEWKKKKGGVVMKYERLTRGARDIFFFFFLFCFIFVGFFSLLLLFFFSSPAPFFCLRLCVSVVFVVARNYGPNWWWRLMADTTERVFFIIICWLFLLFFLGGLLRSLVGRRIGLGNKTRRKRFGSCFFFGFFFLVCWLVLFGSRPDWCVDSNERKINHLVVELNFDSKTKIVGEKNGSEFHFCNHGNRGTINGNRKERTVSWNTTETRRQWQLSKIEEAFR